MIPGIPRPPPPTPPTVAPSCAVLSPAFHPDHTPWARRRPGKTPLVQTCPGATALTAPNYHPAPGQAPELLAQAQTEPRCEGTRGSSSYIQNL